VFCLKPHWKQQSCKLHLKFLGLGVWLRVSVKAVLPKKKKKEFKDNPLCTAISFRRWKVFELLYLGFAFYTPWYFSAHQNLNNGNVTNFQPKHQRWYTISWSALVLLQVNLLSLLFWKALILKWMTTKPALKPRDVQIKHLRNSHTWVYNSVMKDSREVLEDRMWPHDIHDNLASGEWESLAQH
jgi:hypothetical protein